MWGNKLGNLPACIGPHLHIHETYLCLLRLKSTRKNSPLPKVTLGAVAARVGGETRLPLGVQVPLPSRGDSAVGMRVQVRR